MTRLATLLTLTAALLAAAAHACAYHHMWWEAGMFTFVALFLLEAAHRERQHTRRRRAEAQRLARGEQPPPGTPCCELFEHSRLVHTPACPLVEAERGVTWGPDHDTRDSA